MSISSELSQDGTGKKKGFLIRSNALCGDDDTRLRPPDQLESARTKHLSTTSSLSKDSTHTDYTDSTGIDLLQFIVNTLHKNAKDREMLLSLESEMKKFVLDKSRQAYKFPKMSSYNRMLVHRVAAFFGLDHNIDQSGTLVVVTKTPNTRVPDIEFSRCIKNNIFTDKILCRRNVQSFDECRLDDIYGQFQPVAQNIAFGSATAMPSAALGGSLSSLEIMRRARSFEVGEWHNSMAGAGSASTVYPPGAPISSTAYLCSGGGGTSSSNSSSSWQLANNISTANVSYASPRPDSMISPSLVVDPSAATYYTAAPPSIQQQQQPPIPPPSQQLQPNPSYVYAQPIPQQQLDAYNNYVNRLQTESGSNYETNTKEGGGAEQRQHTPVPIYFQTAGSNVVHGPFYSPGVSMPPSLGGYAYMNIDNAGTQEINQPLAISVNVPPPGAGGRKHQQQYQVLYPINSQFATGGPQTDATIVPQQQQQIQYFITPYSSQKSVDCDLMNAQMMEQFNAMKLSSDPTTIAGKIPSNLVDTASGQSQQYYQINSPNGVYFTPINSIPGLGGSQGQPIYVPASYVVSGSSNSTLNINPSQSQANINQSNNKQHIVSIEVPLNIACGAPSNGNLKTDVFADGSASMCNDKASTERNASQQEKE